MKRLLITFMMVLLPIFCVHAQWVEPKLPIGSDLVSGGKYIIKNVAAAEVNEDACFLAGGVAWYSWPSSAILTAQDVAQTFIITETERGWILRRTSDNKYTFISGPSPKGLTNTGEMHMDMDSQAADLKYFGFKKVGNYYRIYAAKANSAQGIHVYANSANDDPLLFWGWKLDNDEFDEANPYGPYQTAVYATVDPAQGFGCDWELINMEVYEAQKALYAQLIAYSEAGYSFDVTPYSSIYEKADATAAELNQASLDLKRAMKAIEAEELLKGATLTHPRDGTSLIANSDFSAGNINGWTCTFVKGTQAQNFGYQGINSYTNTAYTYTNRELNNVNPSCNMFIEAWSNNSDTYKFNGRDYATIGDATLEQTILCLPQGLYKLSCDAIATQQYNSAVGANVTGVQLFATDLSEGGLDNYKNIASKNGVPEHVEFTFASTGGDVKLGLRTIDCTANWIAADNFTLVYYGEVTDTDDWNSNFGECGDSISYIFNTKTGVLEIVGKGAMNDYSYKSINETHVTTAPWGDYIGSITSIVIGNGVTNIGTEAFSGCSSVTSVTIPESVKSIGSQTFRGCSSLTSVTIPESVTSIGSSAFYDCTNLIELKYNAINATLSSEYTTFPYGLKKVTIGSNVEKIPNFFVYNNSNLTDIVIPESVTSIGSNAFQGCSSLTSVTIPEGVTSIGRGAFDGCTNMIELKYNAINATLSSEYTTFPNGLKKVTIGSNVEKIPDVFVFNNSNLTDIIIPESVTSIGSFAFYGCSKLTSITIPPSVTSIGQQAFSSIESLTWANSNCPLYALTQYCKDKLKEVTITDGVTSIGSSAFSGCNLKSLTVGAGVISISSSAFTTNPIKTIWLTNTPPTGYEYASGTVNYVSNDLYTKLSNTKKYPLLSSWFVVDGVKYAIVSTSDRTCDAIDCTYDDTENIKIGPTVTYKNVTLTVKAINEYSLYQNIRIKTVNIENDGIIGNRTFYGCSGMQLATIANKGNIGNYAFYGCSGLQKAVISNTGYIGTSAFEESFKNPSDTSYVHIESTRDIQQNAFKNCSGIKTLEVMNGGAVGSNAFYGCSNLQSATIKNNGDIGTSAFQDAFKVATEESSVLIENKGNIGSNAFKACSGLQTAYIKNTGIIGANAFEGAFSSVIGASNVRIESGSYIDASAFTSAGLKYAFINSKGDIKDNSFYSCVNLDSVEINNTGKVGISAFDGCSKLRVALLGQTVTGLGNYTFRNCRKLEKTIIPNSVLSMGDYCFDGCTSLTYAKIGNGVPAISQYAFQNCGLKAVEIGSGVKTIANRAFSGCSVLPEINIPQNVTSIANYVFAGCSKLSNVSINDRTAALSLGSNGSSPLFADCPLDSVYLGGKITYNTGSSYGYSPFYRNLSLRSIRITDVEDTIYDNEFYGCTGLQHVRIGDGVKTIGKWAFSGCSSLLFFSYGTSLQSIGQEAFSDCVGVTKLISNAATPPVCGSQALEDISKWECTLYVPAESIDDYQAADQWRDFFFMEEYNGENPLPTYALTFLVDGVSYAVVEYEEGSAITLPESPTREGYTFSGWSEIPETMPANNVVVQGHFTINQYNVTFISDGSIYMEKAQDYGSTITLPEPPTKEGYTFSGWSEIPETMPANDVVVQGHFTVNQYNVTFISDGSIYREITQDYSSAITLPEPPSKDGYIFNGWEGLPEDMLVPSNDLTVTAIFVIAIGDTNGDNEIDVADLSAISSYILGHPSESFVEMAADVNKDNEIDVADISALAYLILHPETAQKAKARKVAEKKENIENAYNTLYAEILQAEAGTDVVLPIMMRNTIEATGFQLDLVLPEGVTLEEAALSNARTSSKRTNLFDYARQADGSYRILCNSTKGLSFNGHDGEVMILTLHIDKDAELGAQTIALKDMVLTDATGMLREESSLSESTLWIGNATGIHEIASGKDAPTYDLQGRQVSKKQKGIHIQNGKKTVVK